ncbi:MAG: hypothetical protein AB7I23_21795 [Vicinamibacterales bacterium]
MSRPQDGPLRDPAPARSDATPRGRALAPGGEAYARLEACLAEVRLLELGLTPPAGETWSARYEALGEARNAELAAYWQRQLVLALVSTALVIAVLAGAWVGAAPRAVLAAAVGLGLGVVAAWAAAAHAGAQRLEHWDGRLDAVEAEASLREVTLDGVAAAGRPAATRGTSILIVVFGLFWVSAALTLALAPELVVPPRLG